MVYLYWYLSIGVIVLILVLIDHRFSEENQIELQNKQKGLRENLFERIVLPGLAGVAVLIAWPVPAYLKLKQLVRPTEKAKTKTEEFIDAVDAYHASMSANGYDLDELPEGTGEFGHDSSNPIPTRGIMGSYVYLDRLHWDDGAKIIYARIGSGASEATENPVDYYKITHPDGKQTASLTLSPYQKRNSKKAPKGFKLADHN